MAERAKPGKIKKVAVAGGKDCFEDLPEHVLELLLSFLPSRDAVRTSVLARRWRALWKSVPALRFYPFQFESAKAFNNFVYKLLEHRDRTSPLLQCDIIPYQKGKQAEAHRALNRGSVISKHLTVLELYNLVFDKSPLDLLSCHALELLEIGLLTFELADPHDWAPVLESLPSLVTSFIRIGEDCADNYACYNYLGDSGNESCEDDCCVLLEGLAGATNLELISECSMIFRKDLKWCPVFSKLKTVLLNEWCLTANFTGLLYFLQHTPILEKFTLQLPARKDFDIGSSGSYNPAEYFLVSKHLKGSVSSSRSRCP